ncbi:acyltransferase family protein [Sinomonas terrae]|uniref:Acyltransferase n=1 Tax=Sinomonas terrae TaxID=2908838 RepID=A0ABS9U5E5_9MICC|nr:acyltransferase [Sinomonas terrae]MCH6471810.1 acyltransferase [Sinomonas terrae]
MSSSDFDPMPTSYAFVEREPKPETVLGASRPLIASLTGVRALAAGWVVLDHFQSQIFAVAPVSNLLKQYIGAGYLGVEVFFVLSGFILAYNYSDRFAKRRKQLYFDFIVLRIARIYPVHIVTLSALGLLFLAASMLHISLNAVYAPSNFLANLFLLQVIPPFFALNGPAWSISAEFFAYLAFPFLALWLSSMKTAAKGFLFSAITCITGTAGILIISTYNAMPTSYSLIWLRIATEFTTGCLMYSGWRHLGKRRHGKAWGWTALGSAAAVAGIIAVMGGSGPQALASVPLIAVFVLSCGGSTGIVGNILSSRLLQWGGRISYSVYMTHFLVLSLMPRFIPAERFGEGPFAAGSALTVYFLMVIAVGAGTYYFIENPARRLISKRWARRRGEGFAKPVEAS